MLKNIERAYEKLTNDVKKLSEEFGIDVIAEGLPSNIEKGEVCNIEIWCEELFNIKGTGLFDVVCYDEDLKEFLYDIEDWKEYAIETFR